MTTEIVRNSSTLAAYSPEEVEKARQSILNDRATARRYKLKNRDKIAEYQKEYTLQYRQDNKEKIREYQQQYQQDNKEKLKEYYNTERNEYHHQYYQENKEECKAHTLQYRQDNLEKYREYDRQYYQDNLEKRKEYHSWYCREHLEYFRAASNRRRALIANAAGNFTAKDFRLLCEAFENKCFYCGEELPLGPDHMTPLSKGGSNKFDNIVPACRSCNSRKHAKTFDEYMEYIREEKLR